MILRQRLLIFVHRNIEVKNSTIIFDKDECSDTFKFLSPIKLRDGLNKCMHTFNFCLRSYAMAEVEDMPWVTLHFI